MDSKAYLLINNKDYQLPTRIPFGEYGGNRVTYHGYEISVDLKMDYDLWSTEDLPQIEFKTRKHVFSRPIS